MSNNSEFLWYIPNDVKAGHRGDSAVENHNSLDTLTSHARALEEHGWKARSSAPVGVAPTRLPSRPLAARTTTFEPLIAIRPGYWRPANFASAAATLDHLTGGRVRINIVSGKDNLSAYGDSEGDQGTPLCQDEGVHAAGPQIVDRRKRHIRGRELPRC
ncbi:LLM class flavin-dependent oxidoreductase [Rhizobium johnstonii]|uniref:LLM class flavin-dependent oxidoreductase n=1 Tax=Rhizobium johnstonii TaxID=3019933 RepID=UPI002FF123F1